MARETEGTRGALISLVDGSKVVHCFTEFFLLGYGDYWVGTIILGERGHITPLSSPAQRLSIIFVRFHFRCLLVVYCSTGIVGSYKYYHLTVTHVFLCFDGNFYLWKSIGALPSFRSFISNEESCTPKPTAFLFP